MCRRSPGNRARVHVAGFERLYEICVGCFCLTLYLDSDISSTLVCFQFCDQDIDAVVVQTPECQPRLRFFAKPHLATASAGLGLKDRGRHCVEFRQILASHSGTAGEGMPPQSRSLSTSMSGCNLVCGNRKSSVRAGSVGVYQRIGAGGASRTGRIPVGTVQGRFGREVIPRVAGAGDRLIVSLPTAAKVSDKLASTLKHQLRKEVL